jgi:hypothetical protein
MVSMENPFYYKKKKIQLFNIKFMNYYKKYFQHGFRFFFPITSGFANGLQE